MQGYFCSIEDHITTKIRPCRCSKSNYPYPTKFFCKYFLKLRLPSLKDPLTIQLQVIVPVDYVCLHIIFGFRLDLGWQ